MTHPRYTGPVLDAHCHYDWTTIARAREVIDLAGIQAAISLWDAHWPPKRFAAEAEGWGDWDPRLLRCHVPDFGDLDAPGGEQVLERELRTAAAAGAVGVKVWKNLGLWLRDAAGERLAVDDARLDVLWSTAADVGLPVVIHQGDTPAFFAPLDEHNHRLDELRLHPEWWYGGGDFPPLKQIHEELESVIARHPRTTFVGLHFGCFLSWPELDRMLRTYANYNVDTATAVADMGREGAHETVRQIFIDHPDRVVFGTDLVRTSLFDIPRVPDAERWDVTEWFDRHWRFFETAEEGLAHPLPVQGDWTVTGIDLPDEVLRKFYWDNAQRIFKLPPQLA